MGNRAPGRPWRWESFVKEALIQAALDYHAHPRPGKIEIVPTKPVETRADLALAYTPGVGEASMAIARDPAQAARLTGRSNLVAVITDGTAVLGLGAIGPLAAKPVMEGKSVLFKLLAGVNAFDIELDALDSDRFIDVVAALEPTFGGINLEDIKAPECFDIEERLKARLKIPVMHDDQHGTAVVVAAALFGPAGLASIAVTLVRTSSAGIANPMPCAPPATDWLIPITRPLISMSGPPELPGLIGAEVCSKPRKRCWPPSSSPMGSERSKADTTPTVTL